MRIRCKSNCSNRVRFHSSDHSLLSFIPRVLMGLFPKLLGKNRSKKHKEWAMVNFVTHHSYSPLGMKNLLSQPMRVLLVGSHVNPLLVLLHLKITTSSNIIPFLGWPTCKD